MLDIQLIVICQPPRKSNTISLVLEIERCVYFAQKNTIEMMTTLQTQLLNAIQEAQGFFTRTTPTTNPETKYISGGHAKDEEENREL